MSIRIRPLPHAQLAAHRAWAPVRGLGACADARSCAAHGAVFIPTVSHARAVEIAKYIVMTWLPSEKENLFLLCQNTWP